MGDEALRKDVLDELGEDRIQELAGELGTDSDGAKQVVEATVDALPEDLTGAAAAPAGAVGLGGLGGGLGGGLLSGVLGKITGPVAKAVAKKTGLPEASVARALELLLPVVMTTIAKRRRR
ncbi:DUF937 domain-containing protein [Streptomyces albireticuli]|uniref:DUF937 domain-containing protein n=1 Tax=Streptomyces albireticuli TaxID=1940 RepID=A0A2A2DB37_9ACTN|nr:DUF937 domain-containing protein [Streptomyces albireticuli]MCD9194351.1 DUF937 domain-containing protein [Streptomyces albireticuli]PAU49703.1 hypothetical protein CK936_06390 [Streptomyces albireticuli]